MPVVVRERPVNKTTRVRQGDAGWKPGRGVSGLLFLAEETEAAALAFNFALLDLELAEVGLPADVEAVAGVALGYPGEADQLSEPLRSRELAARTRKGLGEFVFKGWKESYLG